VSTTLRIATYKSINFRGAVLRFLVFGGALCLPFCALGQGAPQISAGGVVSSANYGPLIAPGGIFSIFGSALATAPGGITSTPYPLKINNTQVTVNGAPVPLLFVSPAVINAQMPANASGSVSVAVVVDGASSQPVDVAVSPVGPSLYTSDGSGRNQVAAQHLNFSSINSGSPAQPGEEIILYGTGLGPTNPPLATNTPPTTATPATETPIVTIGGQPAQVLYAGAAGVYPGLYQINVYVPNVVAGNQEVIVSMPGENIASSENATIAVGGANQGTPITPAYFGLHVSGKVLKGVVPWPSFNFGPLRLHDAGNVRWADLNPGQGQYNFDLLDSYVAGAVERGKTDLVYTFVATPEWAASDPGSCSASASGGAVKCTSAPMDLNPDGSGTDQIWKHFVTAIAQRYAGEIPGKISNWEIWNEPNARNYWTGSPAQLVRMQADASAIIKGVDPQAIILTPAPAGGGVPPGNPGDGGNGPQVGSVWMSSYLMQSCMECGAATGADADVIAFHGYINLATQPHAENVQQGVGAFESTEATDRTSKPLWDTEAGWGKQSNVPDPDMEAAFAARFLLAQAGMVHRFYWYHYDYPQGQLMNTQAGVAYGQVFNWLTGSAVTQQCAPQGGSSVWTCSFARQNGFQAMAVWDSNQMCANGNCMSSNFNPPSNMIKYSDLNGNSVSITAGSAVPVGAKPIWLTNQ
jgi:uncharacterized protein (TIGR03437 family)